MNTPQKALAGFIAGLMLTVAYVTFTGGEPLASLLACFVLALTARSAHNAKANR